MRWHCLDASSVARGLVAALILLAVSSSAQATNCLAALDLEDEPRFYECDFKTDQGVPLEGTLSFGDPDGDSFTVSFDLADTGPVVGYCTCQARAGFQVAQFGASRSFACVTPLAVNLAESMEGPLTGNGKKINKGQVLSILSVETDGAADLMRLRFRCKSEKSKKNKK